jgi:gliding motility-associated-like protein
MYVKKILYVVCLLSFVFYGNRSEAQNTSNKGKDFWLGYGNHVRGFPSNNPNSPQGTQKMAVYITSDVNTKGNVEIPGLNTIIPYTVTANAITTVTVPQGAYLGDDGKYNTGIHITAEKPVVVYAHIYNMSISGATLVLPTPTLGKDYVSINYTQISNEINSYSYFFIVAVEDNTEVDITPSADTKGGWLAGSINHVTLNKGQVYQVLGKLPINTVNDSRGSDLTGSKIHSVSTTNQTCKRIAVFSGSGKIQIGTTPNNRTADNLIQQIYPTAAWGKKFITAPFKARNYDIFRIVKSDPAAVVTLNGVQLTAANFINGYYEFSSQQTNVIEGTKPIQVVQYAVTQNNGINGTFVAEQYGDPEMIFLNPVEQTLTSITMYSTPEYQILAHFVNVVILTQDAASFKLDNVSKASEFKAVPGAPEYSYAQISVSQGTHNLVATGGFNAIAYGFGSFESYGYSAGANVKSLSIEVLNKSNNQVVADGCTNEPFNFRITLGYQTSKLSWNLGDGSAVIDQVNPTPDNSYVKDGITYYVYKLNRDIIYTTAKDYTIEVTAENSSGDCGSTEIITSDFSIYNQPVAKFTAAAETCADTGVQFTDQSDGSGRNISSWKWNFGDGTSSASKSPLHLYTTTGTFIVTLTITNESSCSPVTYTQNVKVLKRPVAGFTQQTITCAPPVLRFTNNSVANDGTITKWVWDFGDGQKDERSVATAFDHTYQTNGTYTVTLKVITDKGCESDLFTKSIVVNPSPVVDFSLPEVCLQDAFAQFTDKSSISDGSGAQLTYLWDFGDQATSTAQNPRHKYNLAATYHVTLIVKSNVGCTTTFSRDLTVNGSTPKADFVVENVSSLCSNKEVIFTNKSSVDFGSVTKLVWYFDLNNAPTVSTTDEDPVLNKTYNHLYPLSNTNKSYSIMLQAFSGGVCVDQKITTITVQAVPEAQFTALSTVCAGIAPFQITQGSEIHGFQGIGVYSGAGISASGVFNPTLAGQGTHTLTYTFTAQNGCESSATSQITVAAAPVVNAGRDTVILGGGQSKLNPIVSGTNLTYKWTPSIGLDHDDIANPIATPSSDITYILTVTSDKGCSASDAVFVKVLQAPEIPNTFTPNNDGINDTWTIKYLNSYPGCTVFIYNRYGVKVYSSVGYPEAWDGKMNGNDLPVGTYYYIVDPKNGRKMFSGSVSIIK